MKTRGKSRGYTERSEVEVKAHIMTVADLVLAVGNLDSQDED